MSRWNDQFKNHAFQGEWEVLKNSLEEVEVDDETILTAVQELARLKKVVKYLDELMSMIDPELVAQSTWKKFHQQCVPCKNEIMSFVSNRNITHLTNANDHVDNLLSYIRPWVVFEPSDAVNSMTKSLEEYNSTINRYSEEYREKAKDLVSEITAQKKSSSELLSEVEAIKLNVQKYSSELFKGTEEQQAIKDKIDGLVNHFETEYEELHKFYLKVLEGSEEEQPIVEKVEVATEAIKTHLNDASEYTNDIKDKKNKLEEFYWRIFGTAEETGAESENKGLRQELDLGMANLKEYEDEQKKKHQALIEEVESLLPGATSAGLASSFNKMKESFDRPIRSYTFLFYGSLLLTIITSVVSMAESISLNGIMFVKYSNVIDFLSSLSWKLPVVGAAIWLALFSSRRRSEVQRLQQEYAHKESFARSYNNFKKQIEELDDEDNAMLKSLIVKAVDSISYNASATLDGKHGDKAPSHELMEKLLHEIKAIKGQVLTKE